MLLQRPNARIVAIRIGAALCFAAAIPATGAAQTTEGPSKPKPSATAPLPPTRPADLPAPSVAPITPPMALPSPGAVERPTPSVVEAPALHPLPPASRERMHACGVEWKAMKGSGAATDKTWREFAEICLTR
ncbi:hypothetical protein [Methylocapsa acidiphila]|uniref:hypothetical protein n=1 Tax=Methylocapsa acidiphila TaxID=133552 RepID=UPI0004298181|nr:hypothetical protein [Methylocapsa acidiphila]